MKERPILFSGEMVRAILAGQKTQTRRVIKNTCRYTFKGMDGHNAMFGHTDSTLYVLRRCPYGVPGDRLWVRESYRLPEYYTTIPKGEWVERKGRIPVLYENTGNVIAPGPPPHSGSVAFGKLHPSIFMPRWASRITLEITNVRVERVREITENDAKAEGVEAVMRDSGGSLPWGEWVEIPSYYEGFVGIWNKINAKRGYGWDMDPWVWVIEFQRI